MKAFTLLPNLLLAALALWLLAQAALNFHEIRQANAGYNRISPAGVGPTRKF